HIWTCSWLQSFLNGFAQEIPMQSPISITKFQKSARMTCEIQILETIFDGIVIHWYKQKEGEAPERLLFIVGDEVTTEVGFQENRYMVERSSVQKRCVLTIRDKSAVQEILLSIIRLWDPDIKIFGSGTELRVSSKYKISPPANSEILQKKHEDQIVYVCLIEKFYPEVIRVTWIKDGEEVTDNVVKGDTWQSTEEDEYSIASWLTVPAESEDKKYYCKYEHEEENILLETQVSETVLPLIAYRSKSL
uniref:Ig-like domain-containing protein n=1 Tax=Taeniopygia guttata TaxID=59729 RepID=A0A674GY83_TAEGU